MLYIILDSYTIDERSITVYKCIIEERRKKEKNFIVFKEAYMKYSFEERMERMGNF